jgi:RND family efflux transporter MFP subunit
VKAGESLIVLASADVAAQLRQADAAVQTAKAGVLSGQAALDRENARLDDIRRGARTEDVSMTETKVEAMKTSLAEAENNLVDKIRDAFTKADDAVRGKIDPLFINPSGSSPTLSLFVANTRLKADIEWQRFIVEQSLVAWSADVTPLTVDADLDAVAVEAQDNLGKIQTILLDAAMVLDAVNTAANPGLAQLTLDNYKLNVSSARSNIDTATASLTAAKEKLSGARSNLALAQKELALKKAGSTDEQIAAQQATVAQAAAALQASQAQLLSAEAARDNADAQYAKTALKSPIDGTVASVTPVVGEMVAANVPVVSVISDAKYEIDAIVPEADIAEVSVGKAAQVTLDAFGTGESFEADVAQVDPAETVINGLPAYKVTLRFRDEDARIKSGMTANVGITAGMAQGVLTLPRQAVLLRGDDAFVLFKTVSGQEERQVKLGLKGSNGRVEVSSGLQEGDQVVNFGNGN